MTWIDLLLQLLGGSSGGMDRTPSPSAIAAPVMLPDFSANFFFLSTTSKLLSLKLVLPREPRELGAYGSFTVGSSFEISA